MSHQPPVPDAATSPYPLRAAPLSDDARRAAEAIEADADVADDEGGRLFQGVDVSTRKLGLGAAIGLGAAAALTAFFYARRPAEAAKTRGKRKAKRAKSRRRD